MITNAIIGPCKGCDKRKANCHATCAANPKEQEKPEIHSLQEQAGLIGDKANSILNMANMVYNELFGEEGVRNG